jgi:ribosome-binding protein aMBF1 (putative translation factor)
MDERYRLLARNLATLAQFEKEKKRQRPRTADRALRVLIADLVAARTAAGMTQQQVAARMLTTASVVSRLERGLRTRPTLRTIESYAQAVGAHVEIRVRTRR